VVEASVEDFEDEEDEVDEELVVAAAASAWKV